MFGPSKCGPNQFVVISRYKLLRKMAWEGSTFYTEKFQNFHGCQMNIHRGEYCDRFSCFYEILAGTLNFTLKYFQNADDVDGTTNMEFDLFCGLTIADETKWIVVAPYGE